MTPWLRALLRVTGLLIVLGAAVLCGGSLSAHEALPTPSGATVSPHEPPALPSASLPASPSDSPDSSFPTSSSSASPPTPPSPSSSPSAEPSRHRNRWPETRRERPGRPPWWRTEAGPEEDDGRTAPEDLRGSPETAPSSLSPQQAAPLTSGPSDGSASETAPRAGTGTEPMLRMLPLGSGLILIGLGLGLAFIALRLRRS